jgi:hypothetical protein
MSFNEKRTDLMVAAFTVPDTKDVSQFLSTLILIGNNELSVSRL